MGTSFRSYKMEIPIFYGRKCILGGKDEIVSEKSVIGEIGNVIPQIHKFGGVVGVGLGLSRDEVLVLIRRKMTMI